MNTAGGREDTVNSINGVNLNDMVQNQITFQPSINTVQEFKVDNSTLSAEYGRNSGAIANIATRSGTNQYHGELFGIPAQQRPDARNYFERTPHPAPFKRNHLGSISAGQWSCHTSARAAPWSATRAKTKPSSSSAMKARANARA